jgi:enoyl-[acyl-carrier protein] reductase/trans-2-enoyl-CoA reductase (NAD+)
VRVDDGEMREDVQQEVGKLWEMVANENVLQIGDVKGYNSDFLKLFGFGLNGVDYTTDVPTDVPITGLS